MSEILIIDDKNELREEIAEMLKNEGFDVIPILCRKHVLKQVIDSSHGFILSRALKLPTEDIEVWEQEKQKQKINSFVFLIVTNKPETKNGSHQGEVFSQPQLPNAINKMCPLSKENEFEEILKSIREKVIYSIPHEMYTPLHTILSFGEIIREAEANLSGDEISEIGEAIVKSANRLYVIIQKYLMYIDIETNGNNFARKEVQMTPEYFQNIIVNVAEKYNRLNDLVIEIDTLCLQIKEDWMCFAIRELVDNAFKFSDAGQKVIIKSKKTVKGCEIAIHDEGCGFPVGTIEKIDAFEQFDRKRCEQQGIGLGLCLSKKIIEKHDGKLRIESNPETGTSVHIGLYYIHL